MKNILFLFLFVFSTKIQARLKNESELGIASATGNTRTQTFNAKQMNEIQWSRHVVNFRLRYLNAFANEAETARYFLTGLKYENQFSSRSGIFLGETLEKDKFAGIDLRLITDLGLRYRFIENEKTRFNSEFGWRYMDEKRISDSSVFSQYGRLYTEWEIQWSKQFSTKLWAEYLPNFTSNKDWLFNSELSLMAAINNIFSLKTGILLRYDHFPAPGILYKTDTLFTTSLMAKF